MLVTWLIVDAKITNIQRQKIQNLNRGCSWKVNKTFRNDCHSTNLRVLDTDLTSSYDPPPCFTQYICLDLDVSSFSNHIVLDLLNKINSFHMDLPGQWAMTGFSAKHWKPINENMKILQKPLAFGRYLDISLALYDRSLLIFNQFRFNFRDVQALCFIGTAVIPS